MVAYLLLLPHTQLGIIPLSPKLKHARTRQFPAKKKKERAEKYFFSRSATAYTVVSLSLNFLFLLLLSSSVSAFIFPQKKRNEKSASSVIFGMWGENYSRGKSADLGNTIMLISNFIILFLLLHYHRENQQQTPRTFRVSIFWQFNYFYQSFFFGKPEQ